MKRISVALSAALAVLVVGTAAARVPDAPHPKAQPVVAPLRAGSLGSGDVGSDTIARLSGTDGLAVLRRAADLLPGGLPDLLDEILAGLPAVEMLVPGADPTFAQNPAGPAIGLSSEPAAGVEPQQEPEPAPAAEPARPAPRLGGVRAQQAAGQFPGLPGTGHAAYSAGATIHVDALQSGGNRLANTDVAFSGATFSSAPLSGTLSNEMSRVVSPQLGAGAGFGRGSGLELGIAQTASGDPQITLADKAEALSPPSTDLISHEVGPVDVDPLIAARLLRGQAQSRAAAACTTGVDLSYGQGLASNIGLVQTGSGPLLATVQENPERGVSQSTSRTFLVPQSGSTPGPIAKFGLASEVRQTIAPVALGDALSLEFLGEWVLRATADGKSGSVHYGPGDVSPATPVVRILNGSDMTEVLLQDILGPTGFQLIIPGVAEISIGEDPRAIGGNVDSQPTETATAASAAVDVVRVKLLDGGETRVADLRIGHMEVATAVPAGGIECGIGLLKKVDRDTVKVGEDFVWTVTVTNPNDCVLTSVKVVDTISTTDGVLYSIVSSTPQASSTTEKSLTWNDVGPIQPGATKDLLINMKVSPDSKGGRFTDDAVATGVCGPAAGQANAGTGVPLEARVSLNLPEVIQVVQALAELPRTGGLFTALPALLLTSLGLGLRVLRRRKAE